MLLLMVVSVLGSGCVYDEQTGQKILDPNVTAKVDVVTKQAEPLAIGLTPILQAVYPPAAAILGILGFAFGAWNRRKANTSYALTETVVGAIDVWKKERPNDWVFLEAKLTKLIGPEAENIIRKMRGLPERVA